LQGELNPFSAARVAESAFDFEPQLRRLEDNLSVLELHNGPTGVFKDFGIAFLAAVMEEFLKGSHRAMTLTATTGDTGSSVAHAFAGRAGTTAVILYPSGPVRGLDPKTFVASGGNILPIRIDGNFDDCQRLIREAYADGPFSQKYGLTSANSINIGRLLPQTFYFLYAFIKVKKELNGDLFFSIPSGNFGNLLAGLYAWKFGLPVNGLVAATNANDAFGDFFHGKAFAPRPPVRTISHSMDVGNPSNYERLESFYTESPAVMRNMVYPETVDDASTLKAMESAWKRYGLLLDPHGAVGFAAAERLLKGDLEGGHMIVLSTGHPAKHADLLRKQLGRTPTATDAVMALQREVEPAATIAPTLSALEGLIAGCC
jgi:threonine synthase